MINGMLNGKDRIFLSFPKRYGSYNDIKVELDLLELEYWPTSDVKKQQVFIDGHFRKKWFS